MKKETLQNLLHRYFPEWDESVAEARSKLGFSIAFSPEERWDWFATGKHQEVQGQACEHTKRLRLPDELSQYWVCCFYSDYKSSTGVLDYSAVKGPPFLVLPCPESTFGEAWKVSIEKARSQLMEKHGLHDAGALTNWFWNLKGAGEVGPFALEAVRQFGLAESYAMAWICCFLPKGTNGCAGRLLRRYSLPLVAILASISITSGSG